MTIPVPMTPHDFKDRLIFGRSPAAGDASSSMIDALALSISPSKSGRLSSSSIFLDPIAESFIKPQPSIHQKERGSTLSKFQLQKKHLHRAKTAPAMAAINAPTARADVPKPNFSSQSTVRQGFIFLAVYLSLGVLIYSFNEGKFAGDRTHPVVDALYFCIVTMCTIGYGDIIPNNTATKLFSILFVLVGFGFIDILLSGMVSYVLDLQENYLLKTAKDGYIIDAKKGRMRIRMKVGLALGVVVLCIGFGAAAMHFMERLDWVDSFYLSVMSVTTVGYGDRAFKSRGGRLFASVWLLVSTLAVARAFLFLAEARVDRRQRRMAKWVLGHNMTVSDFFAADIDNNGFVRCV